MEDLIKRQREIEEAPDTMFINGVEYRKVVPPKQELTLTDLIKEWEFNFNKYGFNSERYNQEIEKLVKMIEDWLPEDHIIESTMSFESKVHNRGWNRYRRHLIRKFR